MGNAYSIPKIHFEELQVLMKSQESFLLINTMSEEDMFYLRKLHFLIDFCWNIEVYKPLLKVCKFLQTNPKSTSPPPAEFSDVIYPNK